MTDTIRLYGLVTDSIVDGPGFRTAIFVQGCPYHCEGCHNPDSQPFEGGTVWTLDDVEKRLELPEEAEAPFLEGEEAGRAHYYLNGRELGAVPILYAESVEKADYLDYLWKVFRIFFL